MKKLLALKFQALAILAGVALTAAGLLHPPHAQVRVTWATGSEMDTTGFVVYRSTAASGPYTRVNPTLIPAAPDPLTGGAHSWLDTDVTAGQTYYYQLEDVASNGASNRHGPTVVTAASPPNWPLWAGLILMGLGIAGLVTLPRGRRGTRGGGRAR